MKRALTVALRVSFDLTAFLMLFIAMAVLQNIQPVKRGYFPNDESINYTFKDSTISSAVLFGTTGGLLILIVVLVELFNFRDGLKTRLFGVPTILYAIYNNLVVIFFGYFSTITIADVGKVAVGRLRPNFLDVCKPTPLLITSLNYVSDYRCDAGDNKSWIATRKSFPSGHSSTSIYSAVVFSIYLQRRMFPYFAPAGRYALQALFLCYALFICLSRITDHKHHWTDVVAGAFLGILVAFSTIFYMPHAMDSIKESELKLTDLVPVTQTNDRKDNGEVMDSSSNQFGVSQPHVDTD